MKLVEKQHKVKISEGMESHRFNIEFSAKMARILSDGIYSNKILAIVRELSVNAHESHLDNGNEDTPFDVHLPDYDETYFWIRDYGTGMSRERILQQYSTYGWSNKDHTNERDGCLGLGSKTPFCYHTRTFTVESWYDGVHSVYQCFFDSDNMPCITEVGSEESDEPQGLKVSLPVASGDLHNFEVAAQSVYRYFPTRPKIFGRITEIKKIEYLIDKNSWGMRNDRELPKAIMGVMAYPITVTSSELGAEYIEALRCPFDIRFNIGDLNIEASREGLGYDNRTKRHIREGLNTVLEQCKEAVIDQLSKSPNLWEARCLYYDLEDMFPTSVLRAIDWLNVLYKGTKLFSGEYGYVDLSQLVNDGDVTIHKFTRGCYSYSSYGYRATYSTVKRISTKKKHELYYVDDKTAFLSRAKHRVKKGDGLNTVYVLDFKDEAAKGRVCGKMGLDMSYLTPVSTLPKPTRNHGGGGGAVGKTRVTKFIEGPFDQKNMYWGDTEVDLKAVAGFYVETSRYDFVHNGKKIAPEKLHNLIRLARELGIEINEPIYGVKTADIKKLRWRPWVDAVDFLCTAILKELNGFSSKQYEHDKNQLHKVCRSYKGLHAIELELIAKNLDSSHVITKFITLHNQVEELVNRGHILNRAKHRIDRFGYEYTDVNNFVERALDVQEKYIYNLYPMLCLADNRGCATFGKKECEVIASYVKLIDGER